MGLERQSWLCAHCGWGIMMGMTTCAVCGSNSVRAWRLKRELGTKVRYLTAATAVDHKWIRMYAQMLFHLYRRIPKPSKALRDALRIDIGYCLDAPEVMPAGGCFGFSDEELEAEYGIAIPEQLTFDRESDGATGSPSTTQQTEPCDEQRRQMEK